MRSRALMNTTSKFAFALPFGMDNWMGQGAKKDPVTPPTDGEDTSGGGGGGSNQDPKKKNVGKNDGGTDDALVEELWKKDETGGGNDTQPGNGNSDAPDTEVQMSAYLKKVGLEPIVLSEQEIEGFKNGEGVQELVNRLNQRAQQAHIAALRSSDVLIKQQVAEAVKKAVGDSATLLRDDKARDAMVKDMPWTAHPAFKPVAESILSQFLRKSGGDIARSVKLTRMFFEQQQQAMDPEGHSNTNTGGNNRTMRRNPNGGGDIDFSALLTGKDER